MDDIQIRDEITALRSILGELIPAFWQILMISGSEKGALECHP